MIGFVDIDNELSFQKKYGIPSKYYGLLYARKTTPLPFQYVSSEAVSSFTASRVDNNGNVLEATSLSTSLITVGNGNHTCTGLVDYAANLDGGLYFYLVNGHYKSEYFVVHEDLPVGTSGQYDIGISGLAFYDNTYTVPWRKKIGHPDLLFGIQYAENSTPLYFDYLSSDAVTSFKAIMIDTNGNDFYEYDLSTSLITVTDHHICTGLTDYSQALQNGVYYFSVNGQFESELFRTRELDNSVWILETGIWEGDGIWTSDGIWHTI